MYADCREQKIPGAHYVDNVFYSFVSNANNLQNIFVVDIRNFWHERSSSNNVENIKLQLSSLSYLSLENIYMSVSRDKNNYASAKLN